MRRIEKTMPPPEFVQYCAETPGVTFDELPGVIKKALKKSLLEDQGYICCYCGRRIFNDGDTKIDHIKPQDGHGELILDFFNMLASCDGGDKDRAKRVKPRHSTHCDARKKTQELPVSPLDDIDGLLTFFDDGSVKGKGKGKELIRILGLDTPFLISQRKNAIAIYDDLPIDDIDDELIRLRTKTDGQYEEFCFVLEQHVQNLRDELGYAEECSIEDMPNSATQQMFAI